MERRAQSLEARLEQEHLFSDRAWQRPIFGWGGFDRMRPRDEQGNYLTRGMDSLWVITLGTKGLFGLTLLTLMILMPCAVWIARTSPRVWLTPENAASAAMGTVILLWMVDCLLNGMVNPLYVMALGGLGGYGYARAIETDPSSLELEEVGREGAMTPRFAGIPGDRLERQAVTVWRPVVQPLFEKGALADSA
jgi:hypothetical protein